MGIRTYRRKLRVLIADDSIFTRKLLQKILESTSKFEVTEEVSDGCSAVLSYDEIRPDIVIMDINMPVMDGLTAAKKILSKNPSAVIVIVSASGSQELVIKEARKIGVKAVISKPFNPKDIINILESLLKGDSHEEL
ncbi:MAG: response regulator [Desulfurococcales archaeon]|nr:response regulator [Desulfurococcales archaeon]